MGLDLRLDMKMSQQVVMTPQLQQAIKLLQLSRTDLIDAVRDELMENPMLEENSEIVSTEAKVETLAEVQKREETEQVADVKVEENINEKQNEIDWEAYFENYSSPTPSTSQQRLRDDDLPGYEATLTKQESLFDHLIWQLQVSDFTEQEKRVALIIIGNVNDHGYLETKDGNNVVIPSETILMTACDETGNDLEYVEEVLEMIQTFDPPGVAARSLSECLRIQSQILELGAIVEDVIEEHMDNLERKNYLAIARSMGIELDEVIEAAKLISQLEPRPGRPFSSETVRYITPDIYIRRDEENGGYRTVLNDDGMPRLRISKFYMDALKRGSSSETKKYVTEKLNSARWLINSIDQRQKTIVKVTESIIKFQRAFLDSGVAHLKPLILKDVAEDIGMHESTVSRVTTNKYVHTPQGMFELKYFFNSSIQGEGGDLASEAVKSKIKLLVAAEPPKKPLSDQKLVNLLKEDGITIARRTVAKYREAMNILPSSKRKRLF